MAKKKSKENKKTVENKANVLSKKGSPENILVNDFPFDENFEGNFEDFSGGLEDFSGGLENFSGDFENFNGDFDSDFGNMFDENFDEEPSADFEPEELVVFEEGKPFSDCMLWDLQREYFSKEGINAWVGQVPFYVTSNPYIANTYANTIIRFMQDFSRSTDYNKDKPFYIVELGTGSGRFSFYVIKKLLQLQETLQLQDIPFVYVMTDFTQSNLDHWSEHHALQDFIQSGVVDFALYNAESEKEIHLVNSGVTLSSKDKKNNPLIVAANYLFDTISQDVFRVTDGELFEAGTILSTPEDNLENNRPIILDKISTSFSFKPLKKDYYPEKIFNAILADYVKNVDNASFLFPVGGLRCLANLQAISNNRVLLLSADKGDIRLSQLARDSDPDVAFHGSFSMMVNFHAISEYMKRCGGDFYQPSTRPGISALAFVSGMTFNELPETSQALQTYLQEYGPGSLYLIYKYIRDNDTNCPLDAIISMLNTVHWDPLAYNRSLDGILQQVSMADETLLDALRDGMERLWDNFYYVPSETDALFNAGLFFQEIQEYDSALEFYQRSIGFYGDTPDTLRNMALCYYHLHDKQQALELLSAVVKLNPEDEEAKGWIEGIQAEVDDESDNEQE